jgi:hypothetical protein
MKFEFIRRNLRSLLPLVMGFVALTTVNVAKAQDTDSADGKPAALQGRIIAVGIPGASAVTPVGNFVPTGPIPTLANLKPLYSPDKCLIRSASW